MSRRLKRADLEQERRSRQFQRELALELANRDLESQRILSSTNADHQRSLARLEADQQQIMHRLGEDSARSLELFRRRLDAVGELWARVATVKDRSSSAFHSVKMLPPDVDFRAFEQKQLDAVAAARDALIEVWDRASPFMRELRPSIDSLIEETNDGLRAWVEFRASGQIAEQAMGEDRRELLAIARQYRDQTLGWTKDELPAKCSTILDSLTAYADRAVDAVEAELEVRSGNSSDSVEQK